MNNKNPSIKNKNLKYFKKVLKIFGFIFDYKIYKYFIISILYIVSFYLTYKFYKDDKDLKINNTNTFKGRINFYNNDKHLKIHNTNSFKGRIFITIVYNNEAEFAYIHVWRLYDYVDKFIFLVSNKTFSGLPKNVSFSPYEDNIMQYKDKIDIVYFNNICNKAEYPLENSAWCFEKSQRDYAKNYIEDNYNPTENDLIVVVDVDEILTREGVEYIKKYPPKNFYFLKGSMYFPYYYHKVENCDRSCVIRYNKNLKTLSKLRASSIYDYNTLKYKNNPDKPLITHCSYCFKYIEQYRNKIQSFSHQEFNKPPYITNNWIFKSHYCRVKINSPPGFDEVYEGWKHLIPDDESLNI